ncbi:MAG: TetR/AcrR family transcriptional regulator [Janthinobacterium lividum]
MVPRGTPLRGQGRRQPRADATRRDLVDAARQIFARDGFDLARLEDIAADAGKTRGAFYANFKDKEDVFFAIFEEDLERDAQAIREKLSAVPSPEERLEALSEYLFGLLQDQRRMLLTLEFKLYAIRHPHRKERLTELRADMCVRCAEVRINDLLPQFNLADLQCQHRQAAIVGVILDGLTLNRLFDPSALGPEQQMALIRAGLRIALEPAGESKQDASRLPRVR